MQFNFNFEAFEKSGKEKSEAINYLKGLNSSLDFDKLESDLKGDENAIYEALKGGNFSFSKPSIEQTRQKLLKNKENEALKAEFNTSLSWLDNKQDYNFYDFKKAKEKANSKQGLIKADLEAQEKELKRKEALFEKRLKNESIFTKSLRDTADNLGLNAVADTLEMGLNKLGFKDENYIFESEKEDIKKRALKGVREKLQNNEENFSESEKYALRDKYDELDYKKALEKEKEKLRLIQKDSGYNKSEVEFMEEELGFFHTLFNEAKDTIREFKDEYKSEGVIGADVQKAVNVLKQFEESELLRHIFSDKEKKQELQQEYLKNALVIAELNGFDDVGLSRENELYFIKKDKDKEQKYLVNTGFLDNFWDLIENAKFEIAGAFAGGAKGFNSGKSAKGKVVKSILGAAAGSFGGALMDAKIADMYLNRESNYKRNLEYALQAGLLSIAGDGVIIAAKPMAKGVAKGVKNAYAYAKERTPLGLFSTIPSQNINAANKIIDEVFTPEMKEELKQAQKEYGGGVRGEDLANPVFEKLKESFVKKYGKEDIKTQKIAKLAEIFNQNSLKTKQQEMLDLIRSDKDGSTLAYLLEVAKDDVKIQNNLKNMLNLASLNVEKNLKNLSINPREIKHILDEFEAGNKAAFKEVESQISKLYNEDIRVVLDRTQYENIKKDFLENGVNLDEMTPFLRDLENNVFAKEGVTFAKLNNFRKNLNFYIFNKDKTPNFINTLKKISETSLKAEIDKGIDNIFNELPNAYASIKELYSTSLKDYAAMKELNESIKNLKLQDSAKSADEVVDSLIKYAKGQGENGVNNLQKIKTYLGEENNAFLEMQILNKLFKESVVENDRAGVRVFDSEGFLNRVKELVGDSELYERNEPLKDFGENFAGYKGKEAIEKLLEEQRGQVANAFYKEGLGEIDLVWGDKNYGLEHILNKHGGEFKNLAEQLDEIITKGEVIKRKGRKNAYNIEHNGFKVGINQGFNQKGENKWIVTAFDNKVGASEKTAKTAHANDFTKETHLSLNSNESITQPLFKSKEAREFLELVEGFHKLYKNDAIIAKNFTQGTASQLSTSIATSAEGAIKQKVVKGGFDPIFRLLPDRVLFGLFSKQIQGGALRYHLRKALSRSLNYDDFKLKLERELKRRHFNSNTSRLIEKFMQNLEDFNREKEQFLEAKRIEQARIKEEEQARINTIKTAQENAYNAQEANLGNDILESSSLLKDFGENFAGFKGKEAIEKLLEEQRGQVKGAFYKEGLGDIDLVWGEITDLEKHKGYGLAHILDKRKSEFVEQGASQSEAAQKAAEFAKNEISNIMQNGKIINKANEATRIETQDYRLILKQNWKGEPTKNKWLVTAYMKKEKGESISSSPFTKEDNLSLNSKESIAQKALNLHEKLYLKDNDTPLNVEYKIVNKDDIKPSFELSKTQYRSEKQEELIEKIKNEFNPDLLVNIRGDLKKGNPIITKEGEVISGNHRAAALKELEGENLSKYQKAVKEAFGVELKENEMLVRVVSEDTSEAEIRRFSAASNEGLENNLGEQGVSLFAKYQDKIKALKMAKRPFVADDVYNLKYLVNKALGETSITKENDTSKALFASLARGRNNTILKALNELEKENLEQVSKVANMFFDNAGAFYNLTHDLDLPKMQNLQNYFSDVLVSAAKADFTRAEDFTKLNEDIRAFLDSSDKEAMLKLSPNLVSDLLTKAMGAGFARFARLENPSSSLFDFLNGLKAELIEKGAPDLFSGGKGIKLNERDEFDFAKELILKGQDSEAKFKLYQNLEELKAWKSKSSLNQPTKELKHKMLERLKPLFKQEIYTKDGFKGVFNLKSLSKMTSDKAIQKSINNGFSKEEHLRAVLDIERLFKNANLAKTYNDEKGGKNVLIHRFNSEFENANALITTKESLDKDLNKIYSLELELTPRFSDEVRPTDTKSNTGDFNSQEHMADENIATIAKTDEESIAQKATKQSEKEVLERQIPFIEAEIQKYEAKIASFDERIKKTQTRIQPYLDEINALQKQYDELYFTETRGEEANAKKWLKLEEIKAKQEELRKPYNDALFKFVFPYQRLKGKVQTEIQKLKFGLQDRALRLEEIQNEALNTSKAQKAWLEAFGLKSLEEAYIPNFKAEVKEAINRVLGGEEIKLTKGSFEKLLKRDREEFLPYIKDTLEKANAVIKQVDGALIFAKDYRNERLGKFFASVSRNDEGEWIITSNAPKNLNNLKNKLNEGGELLYSDLPELTIIAKPDLDANALNSEANLKDIIPQKANLEAVNKQKDKEFLEAYEKADFKGKVELAKQDIDEEIKFLEKQKEEFQRIIQQKDYNDIELEQARKILENAKEEVEGHYRIKYMQNGKEMRAYISKTDYFNQGKILSKDEILHKIIQKTIYKDKIENIKKTSDKLKKQIKIIDEYLKEYGDNEAGAISDDIIEKFKYYDFAKNAGKGAVIIGERRKGLYEQAQKVLNSRLLKAKKRATQSKKNYNITYDEARKLFYKGDMSEEQKELFQSVLPIAQKLNVRIRTAIREPYEDIIKDTTNIAGMYRYELNTATLKKGGNYTDTQRAETLLHELIHSVTSRAMSLHKTPLRDKMLSKTQIKAIDEIDQIYKKLYKFKKTFKLQDENGADLYGIKNSHEMLAELANPMFSSKLKEIGLYEKLVNNIMKIILSVRDFIRLRSDKNVYEKLKQCLKDIIENYKDDFTQEYEKQNIRDFTLTSQTQKEQIYTQRQEIKNTLKAKINQAITNENTGEKAILTNKGISKMLSDKAISKSVDNGFSREEHLRAVGVVDELFKRAKRAFSKRDEKDKNLSIYRYNAPFKNANALMTLKEYKQNGKRIYSLELENLEAAKFNPSGKDLAEQLSKSKDADTTTFHTPIDNPDESIAQKSDNIYHSNPHLGAGLVGGVLNGVEQDENGNLSFDPVKFAMGFLGGAAGSKAVKESIKWRANKVKKAYPNIAKNNPTLMEQIAKRDLLTYAKNETQNALTRLLNKNKLFDSTKGLFAGEKALLNEAYAPHKARLEKAKELEGSGADEIEIWEKTGWYKDKDHKWKFEISQRGGELDLAKIKDKDSEAKLGEILKDDELFKAYPQLRDMSVKHVDLSGNYGFYYVPHNDIKLVRPHIQLDIDEIKTSPYKVKEVLYHEIQHAIQHKEQFAYGLSYMAETYERYLKQHGEVEARNIQERMKNPTKIHPHKTMDTDIEDTIAESTLSTEYSEAFSRKLEKSFLDESGRIAYKALIHKAEVLPQSLNLKGFKQMIFNNDKTKQLNAENALIKTPVGEVKVNVLRAFNHYMKNGKNGNHKENRQALNATFMPTLLEPKFVTRDEEGTMYYYKPFISKDKEYHITSIAVKKNGNLDYATSYNATENRLRQMIKHNELVYEKD
ncbi:TPA: hypothetical protein R1X71_001260 [Campylobacter upsaliensis]|nr:hypothetical protein [Campylobacter upsaliensis]